MTDLEPPVDDLPADGAGVVHGRFERVSAIFGRIPHPSLRTRRGRFIAFALVVGVAMGMTVAGVAAVSWTETADFCGRCHTMDPELKAYAMSPHREVACAECHVEPGVAGWIKAKVNGTRQLIGVLTGTFPTPIPAPDHADLPPTSDTCVRCHDPKALVANGGPVKLVVQQKFHEDEPNTKDTIALVLRPAGFGTPGQARGVHWHIDSEVDYVAADARAQKIDYVTIKEANGETEAFLASDAVSVSSDVQPDIDRLSAANPTRRMDCIDCHNRIGHGVPTPDIAIDDAMTDGAIADDLPYIKREGLDRLSVDYASFADADRAIAGLRTFYGAQYPLVPKLRGAEMNAAIAELQRIYRLVATPEMRVTGTTYPNNLGHQSAPGCFRCHDGAHYKVENGALTKETIPSSCSTCHTFPQIGSTEFGRADRGTAGDPRRQAMGLLPQGGHLGVGSRRDDVWRVSHPDLLPELPRHRGGQGPARRHDLQPRCRRADHRDTGLCLLSSAAVLHAVPCQRGPPGSVPAPRAVGLTMTLGHPARSRVRPIRARPEWMSIHEASTLIGVSPATLRRWSDAGTIRAFTTPGGHRRFSRDAVAQLIPADVVSRPGRGMRDELLQTIDTLSWFPGIDASALQAMRRHARRMATAVVASMETTDLAEQRSVLAKADSSAAACGALAASSGVGLRETAEAFLVFRGSWLRTLVAPGVDDAGAAGPSAALVASTVDTFDHLICAALRAHERDTTGS